MRLDVRLKRRRVTGLGVMRWIAKSDRVLHSAVFRWKRVRNDPEEVSQLA
jgi:hypothetical protein